VSRNEHPETRRLRRTREYWQLVAQTAEYRQRKIWEGARRVMTERGFDPKATIQATCDQGDDINAAFVLPDGTAVSCDFREDPATGQAISVTAWKRLKGSAEDDEFSLAEEILRDAHLRDAFDRAVAAYFDFHWRRDETEFGTKDG